jgi:hypothetical protein
VTAAVHRTGQNKPWRVFAYSNTNIMITCPKSAHTLNNGILEYLFDDPVLLTSSPDEGTLRTHVPTNKKKIFKHQFPALGA